MCAAGILVFIYQDVLVFFLVARKQGCGGRTGCSFSFFKNPDHPADHIVEIVPAGPAHQLLKTAEFVYGRPQFFHFFGFFSNFIGAYVAFFEFFGGPFGDVFVALRQAGDVFINFRVHEFGHPVFAFHGAEQGVQVIDLEIYIAPIAFQRVVFGEPVYQLFEQGRAFDIGHGVHCGLFKQRKMVLYNIVTKGVEGADVYFVGVGTDQLQQPAAHGNYPGIGVGKTKNVLGVGIGIEQNFAYAAGKDLGFPGSGPGNYHYGAFNSIYRGFLFGIEFCIFGQKFLL